MCQQEADGVVTYSVGVNGQSERPTGGRPWFTLAIDNRYMNHQYNKTLSRINEFFGLATAIVALGAAICGIALVGPSTMIAIWFEVGPLWAVLAAISLVVPAWVVVAAGAV